MTKPIALIVLLLLAACGGGDDAPNPAPPAQPEPQPPIAQYSATLIAGGLGGGPTCVDGPAIGANLQSGRSFTGGHGKYWLAQIDSCGGSYSRIRYIDTDANTVTTLAVSDESTSGPRTSFRMPTAIAVNATGDLYIADSDTVSITGSPPSLTEAGRSSGIWVLPRGSSAPVKLAGITLPSVYTPPGTVDGQGDAASFGYIRNLCVGHDQNLYMNDNGRLRTVTPDGVTQNVVNPPGVRYMQVIACGSHGSVLVRRFHDDPTLDDYYDPIEKRSLSPAPAVERFGVAYFSAERKVVGNFNGATVSGVAIRGLDGSAELVDQGNVGTLTGAIAYDGLHFDMRTTLSIWRLTRK